MKYEENKLFEKFKFNRDLENTREDIENVENEIKINFPKEYVDFMLFSNGGFGNIGDEYLDVWNLEDIVDFYENCCDCGLEEVVLFASNGAGIGYAFYKESLEIISIPMDSLESNSISKCNKSFIEFFDYLYNLK